MSEPHPYPDDRGVRVRWLSYPVESPKRVHKPMLGKRQSDGIEYDILKSLGLASPEGEQDNSDWVPVE